MAKVNVYEIVTDRIIAEMEKGIIPWQKPWTGTRDGAYSRSTGKPYSLLNQMMLRSGEYATYKQIQEAGGQVRKGEKSSIVVFWKWLEVDDQHIVDDNGNPVKTHIPMLKYYNVFNVDQCDNIEKKWDEESRTHVDPIAEAEELALEYLERENIPLENKDLGRAFYRPSTDSINMPKLDQFSGANEYYSTLYHEMTHSTGAEKRLGRIKSDKVAAFGSEDYSKEELVAEIGSATLMSMMGIEIPQTFKNSVAYLQSWIRLLKNDNRMIVSAASQAQKAVKFICGDVEEVAQ